MTAREAVDAMCGDTHALWSATLANEVCDALKVKRIRPQVHRAEPNHPKGLTLNGNKKQALGVDVRSLARWCCSEMGGEAVEMLGRGSAVRSYCHAITQTSAYAALTKES